MAHLPGGRTGVGKTAFADIQERIVRPKRAAFQKGDSEAGLRVFMDYVFDDAQAWDRMSDSSRYGALDHTCEWKVMITTSEISRRVLKMMTKIWNACYHMVACKGSRTVESGVPDVNSNAAPVVPAVVILFGGVVVNIGPRNRIDFSLLSAAVAASRLTATVKLVAGSEQPFWCAREFHAYQLGYRPAASFLVATARANCSRIRGHRDGRSSKSQTP